MKILVLILVLIIACNAGSAQTTKPVPSIQYTPFVKYKIARWTVREFTPKGNSDYVCVVYHISSLQCFPKQPLNKSF